MSDPGTSRWGAEPPTSARPGPGRAGPLDADVAVSLLQRGQALAEQGDWELAATTFGRVVGSGDPNLHVAALLGLAECRYRMDDEAAALQAWVAATQAPETPLTWRAWKALAAFRVQQSDLTAALRAYRETARRAPSSEQAAIASRIGWLSKELGDEGGAQRAFSRSRPGTRPQPVVTWALLAVTIGIGASVFLFDQAELWVGLFALDKEALAAGEYWRLVTPVLVHDWRSPLHLAFNMYALWIIGPIVEALYGSARFLLIYLLCAAAGSASSFLFNPALSVGASGAIFGLFGVLLVADRVHKPALTRNARNLTMQIGVLIAINLFIGFSFAGIDNAAHIGGLLAGAWLGFILVPRGATTLASLWTRPAASGGAAAGRDPTVVLRVAGVVVVVIAVAIAVLVGPLWA